MVQALEATDKEFLIDNHNCHGQNQLQKALGHIVVLQVGRDRPAPHHVPHGEIHEYDQKYQRRNQPVSQHRGFPILQQALICCAGTIFLGCGTFFGCAVSRGLHSRDDLLFRRAALHAHGVCQKAH